jgi:hypothetical protein
MITVATRSPIDANGLDLPYNNIFKDGVSKVQANPHYGLSIAAPTMLNLAIRSTTSTASI